MAFLGDLCLEHWNRFVGITALEAHDFSDIKLQDFVSSPIIFHLEAILGLKATICNALRSSGFVQEALKFASSTSGSGSLARAGSNMKKAFEPVLYSKTSTLGSPRKLD